MSLNECSKCQKDKPKSQFKLDKKKSNGLSSWCIDCTKKANKKYSRKRYRVNLRDTRLATAKYKKENFEAVTRKAKQTKAELKIEVYGHYSPNGIVCACDFCNETNMSMLCIDHINNDGAEDRRNNPSHASGNSIMIRLKRENYPTGFQILCYNCNITKGMFGKCAHYL